ncbi:hypothetical protein L1987_23233 [Smallanthus sonchifolius]|uniref:Uncharacterized protein n=1 Tax=Smallanthus sonchifolius TaxID=185202 RepID=A0ACB9IGV8_9ASTR|nr:hypothetical protein L1987_23233 [Smallanthus sonchifolius]
MRVVLAGYPDVTSGGVRLRWHEAEEAKARRGEGIRLGLPHAKDSGEMVVVYGGVRLEVHGEGDGDDGGDEWRGGA